jgi:hypothetical protein
LYDAKSVLFAVNASLGWNFPMLSQPTSAVHQQAAKLLYLNNTGGISKGIMTSILPLKRPTDYYKKSVPTVSSLYKPTCVGIYRKKYVFSMTNQRSL